MTDDEIRDLLISSLQEVAPEADASTLEPGESLREALDIDSMDFLRFVTALHDALSIDIPESDYPQLETLHSGVRYLSAKLAAGKS